jgi:8-oxo-dGTP pyrophosphatase MutT (NUDIX family)
MLEAMRSNRLDRAWLAARLAAARTGPDRSDLDLNPHLAPLYPEIAAARPAAVLVPLIDHQEGASVLLTRRTHDLATHAGQIAFPGGRIDAGDESPVAAALREAEEEIGLSPPAVDVVGALAPYRTGTGYLITPVVGLIAPSARFVANPAEVAEIFQVPLSFVIDRNNRQRHSRQWQGQSRHFHALPYGDYYIWGATAGMLVNLADLLLDG